MSRVQLALNVDDIDEAIAFYSKLFATEPAKIKPGYANFAVAEPPLKLVLIENPGHGGTPEPSRCRGRVDRRRSPRPRRAARRRGPRRRRPRTRSRVATRCRTRCGSTIPTARRGRSTPCSPTPTTPHGESARRRAGVRAGRATPRPSADVCCAGVTDADLDRPRPPWLARRAARGGPRHCAAGDRGRSARASPRSASRPVTPASSCSRTPSRPRPRSPPSS